MEGKTAGLIRRAGVRSAVVALALVGCAPTRSAVVPQHSPPVVTSPGTPSPSPAHEKPVLTPGEHGVRSRHGRLPVFRRPGPDSKPKGSVDMVNPWNDELTLLVSDSVRDTNGHAWYRVLLPERPNGSEGWVRDRDVDVVRLHERIEIDLSDYSLAYFRDDRLVDRFRVGIGQPQWPTPTGTFYVWAKVPQQGSTGPYGVFAIGLSGFSPTLTEWPGGGRVAIHGTAVASNRGHKISHGCIRLYNPDMRKLERAPMGTPVVITK